MARIQKYVDRSEVEFAASEGYINLSSCRYYHCVVTVVIIILRCTTLLYNILLSRHLISRLTDTTNS